ncbi:peptidoglycan-binding domain-containing protein [Leptolyngbya sp. PCC 6406]|uniref:peptidoglycan-binding domain-containing protein n=1 Tax=Leptolyngbya sp. PCC 6406 TaxID=1173264 RepID=UPI0002AC0A54|nr:peptidoglycan-binding protein [Leptolyngbya sp. PCC 6406]
MKDSHCHDLSAMTHPQSSVRRFLGQNQRPSSQRAALKPAKLTFNLNLVHGLKWGWIALLLMLPWGTATPILARELVLSDRSSSTLAQVETEVIVEGPVERPTLRLGSEGTTVRELQGMLTLLGYYSGPIDGQFQPTTQIAVEQFQRAAALTPDGIVGPATWNRLLPTPSSELSPPTATVPAETQQTAASPSEPPDSTPPVSEASPSTTPTPASFTQPVDLPVLRLGMHGPAVTRVQERLQGLGFYRGALDGVFGPQTEAAVKAFQRQGQLIADGIIGPSTWQALLRP